MKTLRNDTMTPKSSLTSTVACCSVPIETRSANANIISTQKTTTTLCIIITRRFTLPIGHFFGFVVKLIRICNDQWYIEPANFFSLDLKFNHFITSRCFCLIFYTFTYCIATFHSIRTWLFHYN